MKQSQWHLPFATKKKRILSVSTFDVFPHSPNSIPPPILIEGEKSILHCKPDSGYRPICTQFRRAMITPPDFQTKDRIDPQNINDTFRTNDNDHHDHDQDF